jgi:hypothetical protein
MKKRTREEESAYKRELRARKRVPPADICPTRSVPPAREMSHLVPPIKEGVPPIVGPNADKCLSCVTHLENKKLLAKIGLLELEVKKYQKANLSVSLSNPIVGDDVVGLPKYKPLGMTYKPNSLYGA